MKGKIKKKYRASERREVLLSGKSEAAVGDAEGGCRRRLPKAAEGSGVSRGRKIIREMEQHRVLLTRELIRELNVVEFNVVELNVVELNVVLQTINRNVIKSTRNLFNTAVEIRDGVTFKSLTEGW